MKLHWVELENWRKHANSRVDFDEGTTVIHGSNETGKSTILEALSRGFFDRSNSHAKDIQRIKPLTAHGNVTSTVRIEFTLRDTRYRVEKNFNLRSGTSLYKIVGERPDLISQDQSADEELIGLLDTNLPSGASKPSQWGAFHWLWIPQNNRELPTNKEGDPTTVLHLETKEGSGVLVTPKFQRVQNLVYTAYSQYFTKSGQAKKDSSTLKIQNDIQIIQQRSVELSNKIKMVDEEKQQLEALQQQLPNLELRKKETNEELEEARNEAIDFSAIESDLKASEARVKEAERDIRDAEKALEELNTSEKKILDLQEREKKARGDLSRLEALCEQLELQQRDWKEQVDRKAKEVRLAEELTRDARILWTISDTSSKVEELEKKINRIKEIEQEIETLRKNEILIFPSDKELRQLLDSQTRIEALGESLKERGLSVKISPGDKGSLEVVVDGLRIKPGESSATGTEVVNVGAPGLGTVTVEAKLKQARDAKVDIDRLKGSIIEALNKYKVKSLDELQALVRMQQKISSKINESVAERKGVDERTISELDLELNKLKEKFEEYGKIERTTDAIKFNSVDVDLGKLVNKRETEEERARRVLDEARAKRDKVDDELINKKSELGANRAEQKHFSEELDKARDKERELIRQYGSVENQEKMLAKSKVKLIERREEYAKIKQRYEDLEKGPINRIKRLEQQIANQDQVIQQHQSSIDQLKGRIEMASLEGTYSELAEINSRLEILKERFEKEQIRAESYQLLMKALEHEYRLALSGVVGPIKNEVKCSLAYVTGFLHEDVELNEYLYPVRLGERGFEDIALEFEDGSSGLQEILALCVRLAVAKHLSKRDSQCLVLDDPFVHVSSDRSSKMIELINNAIEECGLQVIVFTHRPMEFAGFTGKMVDIQSVKSA
jgi:hypothetical protein